ncbi:hypothetical protein [Streptomyces sp. CAU 1734]|uniref:hypothetical protein n=1 Tax=Streptomyces sp. CAU 1734 TaxID=3140360 RepID=UPI0032606F7A
MAMPGGWVRKRITVALLALALLFAAAVAVKGRILQFVDGAFLNVVDDCAGTGPLEREIDALPVFGIPPAGTVPAKGSEAPGGSAGCLDDSGDELVEAYRTFRLTDDKWSVADRMRTAAERDGWTLGAVESSEEEPADPADLCFGKRLKHGPVVVRVSFQPAEKQVEVDAHSLLDGTATSC